MTGIGRECEFAIAWGSCLSMREHGGPMAGFSGHGQFTLPARTGHRRDHLNCLKADVPLRSPGTQEVTIENCLQAAPRHFRDRAFEHRPLQSCL